MPLSQKQLEYLALAWQCFETEPKIDYEKFKTLAGLASPHSARELMRVTKNKLRDEYGGSAAAAAGAGAGAGAPTTTTTRPRKRGRPAGATVAAIAAKGIGAGPGVGGVNGTPTKKTGGGGKGGQGDNGRIVPQGGAVLGLSEGEQDGEEVGRKKVKVKIEEAAAEGSDADAEGEVDDGWDMFQL